MSANAAPVIALIVTMLAAFIVVIGGMSVWSNGGTEPGRRD